MIASKSAVPPSPNDEGAGIRCESCRQVDDSPHSGRECDEFGPIVRSKQSRDFFDALNEAISKGTDHTAADIEQDREVDRHCRPRDVVNGLAHAVVSQHEVFGSKARHRTSA